MGKTKSLLTRTEIDKACRAHNCQANASHRINKGDKRLCIKNGRGWDRYCLECARKILITDQKKLENIIIKLND